MDMYNLSGCNEENVDKSSNDKVLKIITDLKDDINNKIKQLTNCLKIKD